jgi:hypothetical protein
MIAAVDLGRSTPFEVEQQFPDNLKYLNQSSRRDEQPKLLHTNLILRDTCEAAIAVSEKQPRT